MTVTKTILAPLAVLSLLAVSVVSCDKKEDAARLSDSELAAQFSDPSNEWRGKPFWAWNGELEKDELVRQVDVLKDMGFGGYFMHSRVALATEYLGEEWFDLTNAVADKGEKEGMINYLYDEDRWPSGTAGGYVTMKPEFRMKHVHVTTFPKSADMELADTLLAVFTCNLDDISFTDLQRVKTVDEAMASKGNTVLAFYVTESERSNTYNGYTMVDPLKREATDYYIELTHDKYAEKCGSRIGTTITGIFTDEPHRGQILNDYGDIESSVITWTEKLPEEYSARFGADLLDDLPYIFFSPEGRTYDKAKWQYVDLAQDMFLRNFVIPQHEWCMEHGIAYTGHFLHEDNLTAQVTCQGSLMRDYEHQDIPGIDNLTQYNRCYWVAKQVSSVAHQVGKKMILSELYGCSGWQMEFEDYKDAGDWQALFGINVRCPHLSWYTMKGEAKRDYPASINFQSGWYKDFKFVEDYYSRLGLILAQGQPQCDLLVISPIESVFAQVGIKTFSGLSPASPELIEIEQNYTDLFDWIEGAHYDFDYGDEEMMSRLCSVSKDEDGDPCIQFGQMKYKSVFVGNMKTMRSSTLALLKEFAEAGGKIILAGDAPCMVDVECSDEASSFLTASAKCVPYTREGVVSALSETVESMMKITDGAGKDISDILCQIRKDGDRTTYVMMSMLSDSTFKSVNVVLPSEGEVSLWNCRDGKVTYLGNTEGKGEYSFVADFAPLQEYVYVVSNEPVGEVNENPAFPVFDEAEQKAEGYEYALNEMNVLPLDMASYKTAKGESKTEQEILRVDRQIRRSFGLRYRGGGMLQPWFFKKYFGDTKPSFGEVVLNSTFDIQVMPEGEMFICIEGVEDFEVKVNGTVISTDVDEWWIDPCYSKIPLDKKLLKVGKNVITLTTDFTEDKNLEDMFIIGDFGVSLSGTKTAITRLPETLKLGDIVPQGLPFYSGTVSYNFGKVDAAHILASEFGGACVKARKGENSTMIAYAPFIQDVPEGEDDLWLDVVLTRRNTFGPLHYLPAKPWAIGPENFVTSGSSWSDDYVTLPAGLLEAPLFSK